MLLFNCYKAIKRIYVSINAIQIKNYFNQLPEDLIPNILSCLDDKTIFDTALVCKNWNSNPVFADERIKPSMRQYIRRDVKFCMKERYPRALRKLFLRSLGRSIRDLPVLDMSHFPRRDYVTFLQPSDMLSPIMRFRDRLGQQGLAFHLVGIGPGLLDQGILTRIIGPSPLKGYETVLVIFKRAVWTYCWSGSDMSVQNFYTRAHDNIFHAHGGLACPGCPFLSNIVRPFVLVALLTGRDRFFRLGRGENPHERLSTAIADANLSTTLE